jgi:uncharacterized protein
MDRMGFNPLTMFSTTSTIVLMNDTAALADLLLGRSRVRRRILELLLGQLGVRYHLRGIQRLVETSPGTASRELQRLVATGLVERRREGNQVYFSARADSPFVQNLRGLIATGRGQAPLRVSETAADYGSVATTAPPPGASVQSRAVPGHGPDPLGLEVARRLSAALRRTYGPRLRGVYLYGSRARGDAAPDSDVDVLVVLDRLDRYSLELERTSEAAADLSLEYGVSVSRAFVPEAEWIGQSTAFLASVGADAVPV